MSYRVEAHYWRNQSGYSHSETIDNLSNQMTAEEYVKALDYDLTLEDPEEAVNVEIYSEDDALVSEHWCQKEN